VFFKPLKFANLCFAVDLIGQKLVCDIPIVFLGYYGWWDKLLFLSWVQISARSCHIPQMPTGSRMRLVCDAG